jgi:prepilin-type N-terminal cleavage/methylation domain-containing protein
MLSLAAFPMKLSQHRGHSGFSFAEVLVSLAIFGIMAGSSLLSLNQMNNRAFVARCQTGASTVAQNQIDLILSNMPFNPQKSQVPPELTLGTTTKGTSANPTVPIYTDPVTQQVVVSGWMTTTVEDLNTTHPVTASKLNMYRATVSVYYRFRGRTYPPVVMSTIRCSDL